MDHLSLRVLRKLQASYHSSTIKYGLLEPLVVDSVRPIAVPGGSRDH